jgi:hypothetical protein
MLFSLDGQDVTQTIAPEWSAQSVRGFCYTFELPGAHAPVRFMAPPHVRIASSAGRVENGVLTVPAERSTRFSVSVFPEK